MAIQNFLQEQIDFVFNDCNAIKLYKNGQTKIVLKDDKLFNELMQIWQVNLKNSFEMPSLGVSLDNETKQALKNGYFVEFLFEKTMTHNDMPFDSLLIELTNEQGGYQLIRGLDNTYEGRCFYLNLFENDNELLEFVDSSFQNENVKN